MVRFSDILGDNDKRKKDEKKEEKPLQSGGSGTGGPSSESKPAPDKDVKPSQAFPGQDNDTLQEGNNIELPSKHEVRISDSVMWKTKAFSKEESVQLYKEAVVLVGAIYNKVKSGEDIVSEDKNIITLTEKFVNQEYLGNDNVLNLINQPLENFICNHIVNVCILSIDTGIGLGYDRLRLLELGIIAMLHEIGLMKLYDTQGNTQGTAGVKRGEVGAIAAAEILSRFGSIFERIITYVSHEQVKEEGFQPRSLKGDSIDEYSRIIKLVDRYEFLIHPAAGDVKFFPYDALVQLIKEKVNFDRKVFKIFIEKIGPFPVGSEVKLSSEERGYVVKRNISRPLSPVVEVIFDAKGNVLEESRIVDLSETSAIQIKSHIKKEHREEIFG